MNLYEIAFFEGSGFLGWSFFSLLNWNANCVLDQGEILARIVDMMKDWFFFASFCSVGIEIGYACICPSPSTIMLQWKMTSLEDEDFVSKMATLHRAIVAGEMTWLISLGK